MRTLAVFLLGVLFVFAPATDALAKSKKRPNAARGPAVTATRLTPYVGAAGGGRGIEHDAGGWIEYNMRGGGHVGTRLEVPVNPYFVLDGLAEFGGTATRGAGRHDLHLDFSFWAKGRYVFDFRPFDLEISAGVPLGMTLGFLAVPGGRDVGGGLNSGFLVGSQFLFKRGGLFFDLGGRFRRTWYGDAWSWGTRQFNTHFGGVIYF
ncbi:MAG: hypothetical protein GXY23_09805 [Myxococcales bacterium]|nr:hypothetical protein [Myxococcales bacterium]